MSCNNSTVAPCKASLTTFNHHKAKQVYHFKRNYYHVNVMFLDMVVGNSGFMTLRAIILIADCGLLILGHGHPMVHGWIILDETSLVKDAALGDIIK